MKYTAKPVIVDAFIIVSIGPLDSDGSMHCATDDGKNRVATAEMMSRYAPHQGDYWVIQSDDYEYLNPKAVFERKYKPLEAK